MRIAIVNDVAMAVEALRRIIVSTPRHQVAWIAMDGAEAVARCAEDTPDAILMDLMMPVMDGVEATRRIMAQSPCAILVVTAAVQKSTTKVFEALGAGALDAVDTPQLGGPDWLNSTAKLIAKFDMIQTLVGSGREKKDPVAHPVENASTSASTLVAIGASAGGPAALAKVLSELPADFPASVIVVQHVDEQFMAGLANWLNGQTALTVRLAKEGERPAAGVVLVAGTGDHLVFKSPETLGYVPEPVDCSYRPSIDTFFESVTRHWHGEVVGVLLTGMGRDGAKGLKTLRDTGHHTITQDRETSAVYGMPKAAAAIGAAVAILSLDKIAQAVTRSLASLKSPK